MQVIPCALADITRSAAALNALRLVVERLHLVRTALHMIGRQCLLERARAIRPLPQSEHELVALFRDAVAVLDGRSEPKNTQQHELRALINTVFPCNSDGAAFSISTDGLPQTWVLKEARRFAVAITTFIATTYPLYRPLQPFSVDHLNATPMSYLAQLLQMDMAIQADVTPFVATNLGREVIMSTELLVALLPTRIFQDMDTTRQEITDFLKRFKVAKVATTKQMTAKCPKKFQKAQQLVWNLVFNFNMIPVQAGQTFQGRIKTDGDSCYVFVE
jgi:hypothetical protein